MTDPEVADKTYIEPITKEILEKILIKEKPDAILPTMRGRAWIYGKTEFFVDQSDPFLSGYTLSDTW